MSVRMERGIVALAVAGALVSLGAMAGTHSQTNATVKQTKAAAKPATAKSTAPKSDPAKPAIEKLTALKSEGSKSAPITIEVFSDYECPACKGLFLQTLPPLIENYVHTGKVYLIHRDFPLTMHKYSREAARYANAAALIGKFGPVNAALFNQQERWASNASGNGDVDGVVASVLTPAEMAKVRELAKSKEVDMAIQRDYDLGEKFHHVTQTPTSVVEYKGQTYPIVSVIPYPILKTFLDQKLSQ